MIIFFIYLHKIVLHNTIKQGHKPLFWNYCFLKLCQATKPIILILLITIYLLFYTQVKEVLIYKNIFTQQSNHLKLKITNYK